MLFKSTTITKLRKLFNAIYRSKTIKNFTIYGFGQAINIISPLIITPYLVLICGIEKLGLIAIGQSIAYILIVIVDYSSYIKGVKEITINRDNKLILENQFITIYFAKFLLLLFITLITIIAIFLIPYFNQNGILILLSLFIVIGQFINPTWFFQGVENFKWITIINILSKVIFIAGTLFFITKKEDFIYANFWLGFGAVIANSIGFLWVLKTYKFSFYKTTIKATKQLLVDDFSFCVSQLFFAIRNYSTVIIIDFFAGNYVAGQFKVIEQIINFFRTYLQLFFKFSYSYVCFELDKNIKKGLHLWKKFNGLNFCFLIVLLIMVYLFSNPILRFFKVEEGLLDELEIYLAYALFIPLLIGLTLPFEQLMFSFNKNKEYISLTIASTIFNILALSIVMQFFGLKQAFFVLIFTELILAIIYLFIVKPYFSKEKN